MKPSREQMDTAAIITMFVGIFILIIHHESKTDAAIAQQQAQAQSSSQLGFEELASVSDFLNSEDYTLPATTSTGGVIPTYQAPPSPVGMAPTNPVILPNVVVT